MHDHDVVPALGEEFRLLVIRLDELNGAERVRLLAFVLLVRLNFALEDLAQVLQGSFSLQEVLGCLEAC